MPAEMLEAWRGLHAFYQVTDKGFPLTVGFELLNLLPEDQPNPDQQFRFEVALHEPGVCESASLAETLHELTVSVENAVRALVPRFRETP